MFTVFFAQLRYRIYVIPAGITCIARSYSLHHFHAAVGAFIANYTVLRESVRCHHKSVILPAKVDERTLDPLPKMIHEYTAGHRTQKRHSWTGEYEGFDFRNTSAHGTQVPVDESSARGCHADELYEGECGTID